ncbi:fam-c protein [Plasmodium vinckei petteri]|uniref:Fam-c protein n=1 Tax=Plasmodium vinckei petteri TaxID=138298 RepID=A0A6V7TEC4_PLAVN|nr:fam-c protein [Plasmodium vinckei petteri]
MNRRIFSLVCILFYVFMAVSIYCSEQKSDRSKTSGLRSRVIRAIQKIKRSNKKNDIEPQRENQSNNNSNNSNNHEIIDNITYYSEYRGKKRKPTTCCCFTYESNELYD